MKNKAGVGSRYHIDRSLNDLDLKYSILYVSALAYPTPPTMLSVLFPRIVIDNEFPHGIWISLALSPQSNEPYKREIVATRAIRRRNCRSSNDDRNYVLIAAD